MEDSMKHRFCDQIREDAKLNTELHVLLKVDLKALVSEHLVVLHDGFMQYCEELYHVFRLKFLDQIKNLSVLNTSSLVEIFEGQNEVFNQINESIWNVNLGEDLFCKNF